MIYVREDLRPLFTAEHSLDDFLAIEGETVKHVVSSRRTARFQRDGKWFYIKCHWGVGWREIIKNLTSLRLPVTGARNEWRAIQALEAIGVDTMRIAAFGEQGINPAAIKSFVITDALEQTESLEKWLPQFLEEKNSVQKIRLKRAFIRKIAVIARSLHTHGINHRDFYLCHFLLYTGDSGEALLPDNLKIHVIDLHRAQIRRHTPRRWIIKDLSGLFFSSMNLDLTYRDWLRFMRTYRNKPLRQIVNSEADFWKKIQNRAKRLYRTEFGRNPPLRWLGSNRAGSV